MKFFILAFFLINHSFASEEILFYVHGGAMTSYRSDKVLITPDHKVKLTTISPTFADYPNLIGEFSMTLTKQEYDQLSTFLKKQVKEIKDTLKPPFGGSSVEELHIGGVEKIWSSNSGSKNIVEIRKKFLEIAKRAYQNPVRALKLECTEEDKKIQCSYHNVGKEMLQTVDPLGVSLSIYCEDPTNHRTVLHKLKETHPKKMSPKTISIPAGDKFTFSVKTEEKCLFRVVVKTTDMLINDKYSDVLLGELVSDQISK